MMQNSACPSCGNAYVKKHFRRYTSPIDRQEYKAYHCRDCDLEFWSPRKLEKALYEEDVFDRYESAHENINGATEADGWYGPDRWFKEYVQLDSGNLLDVGCGNGTFLLGIRELGLDTYGIDFATKSIDAGRRNGLENLYSMSLDEFSA